MFYSLSDAPGVRLTVENYPNVHDVCGLLKVYLREGLLEPLMTQKLYVDFIANAGLGNVMVFTD